MADFSPGEGGPSYMLGKLAGQIDTLTTEIYKLREASHKTTNELTVLSSIKEDIVELRTSLNRVEAREETRFVALELRTNALELEQRDRSKYWTGARAPWAVLVYLAVSVAAIVGAIVATESFIASHWRSTPAVTYSQPPGR
jgi:ABC-type Fe3+ transport system permease subunit